MMFETSITSLRGDRELNQDRCAVVSEGDSVLLLLADGMGGHPRGELAAQIFVDTGRAAFTSTPKPIQEVEQFLDELLEVAHERIIAFGHRQQPPIDPRTTVVVALVEQGILHWNHVGDSRLYLIRDQQILLRTQDHSFVEHLRRQGLVAAEDTATHRMRNLVTQCLGGRSNQFGQDRGQSVTLLPGDLLLLCSDGLWGQIQEAALLDYVGQPGTLARLTRSLAVAAERARNPSSDNVSVLALRWLGAGAPAAAAPPRRANGRAPKPAPGQTARTDPVDQAIQHLRSTVEDFEAKERPKS